MEIFEFFVEGPPLSQQTRNPTRLREWKEYVRGEAERLWLARDPYEGAVKLTVVFYLHQDRRGPDSRGAIVTPSTMNESGRNRLERIAADYQTRGYDIIKVQPRSGDLPDILAGLEPDLIISGKGETVVVEVKTRGELTTESSGPALESALQNRPGWRFELIIDGAGTEPRQTLSATQIRSSLEEATELEQRNHRGAALLLLWSATEGALRLLASRENVNLESVAPGYVVSRLYTLGLLGREQYQTLDGAMRLRNQAAHGFEVSVTPTDLLGLSTVLTELLNEVDVKAA